MATSPIGGASIPWGWVPPEWDTSGGVAPGQIEEPLVAGPELGAPSWPPPEWGAQGSQDADTQQILALAEQQKLEEEERRRREAEQLAAQRVAESHTGNDEGFPPATWQQQAEEIAEPALPDPNYEADADELVEVEDNSGLVDPYAEDLEADDLAGGGEIEFTEEEAEADRQAAINSMSAEELAEYTATKQHNTELERSRLELAESDRQLKLLEENVTRRETARSEAKAKRAQLEQQAKQMADGSPFQQWWSTRSNGQKLAGYLTAMLGGYLAPQTGGRNSGIDFMTKLADDDANQKWTAWREQRQLVGDAETQADADYDMANTFRLASYEQVIRSLDSQMNLLDPEGTAALKVRSARDGVRAAQAAALDAAEKEHFGRTEKMIKLDQDERRLAIDAAKAQSEIDKRNAEIAKLNRAGTGGASASKVKYTPEELAVRYPGMPTPPAGSAPMTDAEYSRFLEAKQKGQNLAEPTEGQKLQLDRALGDPRKQGQLLRKADGSVYLMPADAAPKLRSQFAKASRIVDILDEIDYLRGKVGGETSWGNSDEYRRIIALKDEVVALRKAGTEGMSSDADMARLEGALGAKDPTSFRSQAAGIKQGRINVEKALQAELRAALYDGPQVAFPRKFKAAAKTPDQRELDKLVQSQTGEKGQSIPTLAVISPAGAAARIGEALIRSESTTLGEGDEKAQIDSWAKMAVGSDQAQRATGRAMLKSLEKSRSPAIRRYADGLLADIKAKDFEQKTGEKVGSPGFVKALFDYVQTPDEEVPDEEAEE